VSDPRLRDCERRWRESGAVTDEAALLNQRVRVGDLARERLELAAFVGGSAARLALGWTDPLRPLEAYVVPAELPLPSREDVSSAEDLGLFRLGSVGVTAPAEGYGRHLYAHEEATMVVFLKHWAFELRRRWGDEVNARVAIAVARLALPLCSATVPSDRLVSRALKAGEDAVACPCNEHARLAEACAAEAARAVQSRAGGEVERRLIWSAQSAALPNMGAGSMVHVCASQMSGVVGELAVHVAIRDELVPWALGYGDPVRMRVAKRGEIEITPEDLWG
jgi:hypothetical protein